MEAWRLLAGTCVLLVIWVALVLAFGQRPGPLQLLSGLVFAAVGMYLGELVSNRIDRDEA